MEQTETPSRFPARGEAVLYVVMVVLFASAVLFVPTYTEYNPDEALAVVAARETDGGSWYPDTSWIHLTHLMAKVDYYLLARVTTVDVRVLQIVAAGHLLLSLVYLLWLSYRYRLFDARTRLIFLLLFISNGSLYFYGQWGVFDYSQRILLSVMLLHVLLFLDETGAAVRTRTLVLLAAAFSLVIVGYAAMLLPIGIVVAVACCFRRGDRGYAFSPAGLASRTGAVLIIPAVVAGIVTLAFFTHDQFLNPRTEILGFFYPKSGRPFSLGGVLGFLFDNTRSFLYTTFHTLWPPQAAPLAPASMFNGVTTMVAIAFGIGLTRSLVRWTDDSRRFIVALFVLVAILSQAVLGLFGIYAYGDIRYALFMYGPLLVVAAQGVGDVAGWLVARVRRVTAPLVTPLGLKAARAVARGAFVVFALFVSLAFSDRVRKGKADYSDRFGYIIETLTSDPTPALVLDAFALVNLQGLGINSFAGKNVFLFDSQFFNRQHQEEPLYSKYREFLGAHREILWVSYYHRQLDDTWLSQYLSAIAGTHVKTEAADLRMWRLARWQTADSARESAAQILDAYGKVAAEVMAAHPLRDSVVDVSRLPYTKSRIKFAHYQLLNTPGTRALLEGTFMLLANFQPGVGAQPAPLPVRRSDGVTWASIVVSEREVLAGELKDAGGDGH